MPSSASADPIDLRSDTVTRPTPAMRRAMARAEVGDDCYGEDPTVIELEEETAERLGMPAALFLPSGTMGNQIALRLHGAPGGEVICDSRSHIVLFELGGMAALSGLLPRALTTAAGLLGAREVEAAVLPSASARARSAVIAVENTHNMAGGTVYDRPALDALLAVSRRHRLRTHLDGARLWNAALALGTTARELARGFDSVMVCLSKGLGAPVGSLLAGGHDFVAEARRVRRMLGGGMRQAGVLAAAGLIALRDGPRRLAADHRHAALLAAGLADLPGLVLDAAAVRTNIVVFRMQSPAYRRRGVTITDSWIERFREAGVLASDASADEVRLVTHCDVGRQEIDEAIRRIRGVLAPAVRRTRIRAPGGR